MTIKKSFASLLFCVCAFSSAQAAQTIKTDTYSLTIKGGLYDQKLYLNGKAVYENPDLQTLSLDASFLGTSQGSDIYLLQTATGGNACPAYFRFVTVETNGKATVSEQFGTCSDLYEIKYNQKELSITIPKMTGGGNATYLYVKGQVKERK